MFLVLLLPGVVKEVLDALFVFALGFIEASLLGLACLFITLLISHLEAFILCS